MEWITQHFSSLDLVTVPATTQDHRLSTEAA